MPNGHYFWMYVEMTGTRMLRIRRPRLPSRSPSDTSLFERPPDVLTYARALLGFKFPTTLLMTTNEGPLDPRCCHGGDDGN